MQIADTSIVTAKTLLIHSYQDGQHSVLTPNPQGHPLTVSPPPILRRAAYLTASGDIESEIMRARGALRSKSVLLAFLRVDAGGTIVTSRVFVFQQSRRVTIADNLHGRLVDEYVSRQRSAGDSWWGDWQQGNPGFFMTGESKTTTLWKIIRLEMDAFDEALFTLRAVGTPAGFPVLRLDSIESSLIRQEIAQQYEEMQNAFMTQSYRAVVTYARNIIESILGFLVAARRGCEAGRDLAEHLRIVKKLREEANCELEWLSDLSYHLAHKIRLVHARTHIDRMEVEGRPITLELALSCAEDLKEILKSTGLIE